MTRLWLTGTTCGGRKAQGSESGRRLLQRILGRVADTSQSGLRVALKPDRIIQAHGKPRLIVSDNDIEFASRRACSSAGKFSRHWTRPTFKTLLNSVYIMKIYVHDRLGTDCRLRLGRGKRPKERRPA